MKAIRLRCLVAFTSICALGGRTASANPPSDVRLVVQGGHGGIVISAAFSPDGRFLVTCSVDATVRLWDAASALELRQFQAIVNTVTFSSDGRLILGAGADFVLWESSTGRELRRIARKDGMTSAAFSADGRLVLMSPSRKSVELWDIQTWAEIRRTTEQQSEITSIAVSPDGRTFAAGDEFGGVRIYEVSTAREVRRVAAAPKAVWSLGFSPDSRLLATSGVGAPARLWDAQTGAQLRELTPLASPTHYTPFAFSPDGRHIAESTSSGVLLRDLSTGVEVRRFIIRAYDFVWGPYYRLVLVNFLAFSPDGRYLAVDQPEEQAVRLWDLNSGEPTLQFGGGATRISYISVSLDGRLLAAGKWSRTSVWDLAAGKLVRDFPGKEYARSSPDGHRLLTGPSVSLWDAESGARITGFVGAGRGDARPVGFSTDGRLALTSDGYSEEEGVVRIWDARSGSELRSFRGLGFVGHAALTPDGRFLVAHTHLDLILGDPQAFRSGASGPTSAHNDTVRVLDFSTGREVRRLTGKLDEFMAVSPDGRWALTRCSDDPSATLWELATGRAVRQFELSLPSLRKPGITTTAAFSVDGKSVLIGTVDGVAWLFDPDSGELRRTFTGHAGSIDAADLSADGRILFTGGDDSTSRLWDIATGQELCRLIDFKDGTWAVVDPDGRYDASNGGDVTGLHWVVGNEPIALSQLKDRYYEPGLLAKILGFNNEPRREVTAFKDVALYPSVEVIPPEAGRTKARLILRDRGGGIGRVRVLLNGKEVAADARDRALRSSSHQTELSVDFAGSHVIAGETNRIGVVAWNAEGYLSSRPIEVGWKPPGASQAKVPEVYAIVGGVGKFAADCSEKSRCLDLGFPAKDAEDMAQAIEVGAKRLFGAARTHVSLLTTSGKGLDATKANFEAAFASAEKAKPWDVLVVYLAGHGVTVRGSEDFYCYPTREARSLDFVDPAIRKRSAITSEELVAWTKKIPALKQFMILDTCAAGSAAAKLAEQRAVPADQVRAIERMKDRTSFYVLMGSASDAVSYEASQYGQGLLTYALLQGMRGAALRDEEFVDVSRLCQWAADQVPQLARNIGGIQRPLIAAPKATSFDFGRLTSEDRKAIPIASVRPIVLKPVILNTAEGFDDLELGPAIRKRLQEGSYVGSRGPSTPSGALYVDAEEMPGAFRPSGFYTVEGETVRAEIVLIRDQKREFKFTAAGAKSDLKELIDRIVTILQEALRKSPS